MFEGRQRKAIVVVDMVESVRLIEKDEASVINRWRAFTHRVRSETLPATGGSLVKSLGDGMMLTFAEPRHAVAAALEMRRLLALANATADAGHDGFEPITIRIGIHVGDVVADDVDIYGQSANLTARITTLASPGEIVVSAAARDGLTDGLDGDLEDLGECYLKHVQGPVRVYRVGHADTLASLPSAGDYDVSLQPSIAVLPFEARSVDPSQLAIGDLIADGVITQLGRNAGLRIISRLSSRVFRGRHTDPNRIGDSLGVHYVLSGSYVSTKERLVITAELVEARSGEVAWSERMSAAIQDLFEEQSELAIRIAEGAGTALRLAELKRVRNYPPPTLASYALMLGGINLMHHTTRTDFAHSQQLLNHVIDRHPKTVAARAWLAKSYVLGSVTGFGAGLVKDGRLALDLTNRALHIAPDNALCMAVQGYVYCHLLGDQARSLHCLDEAVRIDPNEPMAWLFRSVAYAMWGDTAEGVNSARQAELISPRDPLAYFFLSVKASTLLANGQLAEAITTAAQSWRLNCHHSPTLRVLLTAQHEAGQHAAGMATLQTLRQLEPGFSLAAYRAAGNAETRSKQQTIKALRALGMAD